MTDAVIDHEVDQDTDETVELHDHVLSIPNVDLERVVFAAAELGMSSGSIGRSVTMVDGVPINVVNVRFQSEEESITSSLYAFGGMFKDVPALIANDEVWENVHTLLS